MRPTPPFRDGLLRITLAAISLLALVLRLLFLERKSFWLDEATSFHFATMSWQRFVVAIVPEEPNMTLYYVLLRGWRHLGESEGVVRGLSALAGAATVPVIYLLGKRLFGTRIGVFSALLLAVNVSHVGASQEARSYPLAVLLVTSATLGLASALEHGSPRRWAAYVAAGALALYAHFFAALTLVAHAVSLAHPAWRPRALPRRWTSFAAAAGTGVAFLAIPLVAMTLARSENRLAQIPPLEWEQLTATFLLLTGGGDNWRETYAGASGYALLALYAGAALLFLSNGRPLACRGLGAWPRALLVAWTAVPITLAAAISLLQQPVLVPRYLVVSLPAVVLLGAAGFAALPDRRLGPAALAVACGLSVPALLDYYARPSDEDWRRTTAYVLTGTLPGDGILFHAPYTWKPFAYYQGRLGARSPGAAARLRHSVTPEEVTADLLDGKRPLHPRLWLVLKYDTATPELAGRRHAIEGALERSYRRREDRRFGSVRVRLYSGPRSLQTRTSSRRETWKSGRSSTSRVPAGRSPSHAISARAGWRSQGAWSISLRKSLPRPPAA